MRQSQLFSKVKKEFPKEAEVISHKLLIRGDFIDQLSSGIYSFLPLGFRVQKKIEKIIREEMEKIGAQEVYLPTLQPKTLWLETKRWQEMEPPLFKFRDRHKKEYCLGSTHEEVITDLIRKRIRSWKELPISLFQIQSKFRNEMRATSGLLRTREFLMKDLYSFHSSEKDLKNFYQKVCQSYFRIFRRCGLRAIKVEALTGTIGGKLSHEFMILSKEGEDKALICQSCHFAINIEKAGKMKKCPKCKSNLKKENCIEAAHTFYLGEKYSKEMKALFLDRDGRLKPILMGCFGIGLGRLMGAVVEVNHDKRGIIWPKAIAPFQFHLIPIEKDRQVKKIAEKIYWNLQKLGKEVLYDDRENKSPGEKFAEADLIGIPYRLVLSKKTLKEKSLEIKKRSSQKLKLVEIKDFLNYVKEIF